MVWSNILYLCCSTSKADITNSFLIQRGLASYYDRSSAIDDNILAESWFLLALLYNSAASNFLFYWINYWAYYDNKPSIYMKLFFSANSIANVQFFNKTQQSTALLWSPILTQHSTALSHNWFNSNFNANYFNRSLPSDNYGIILYKPS